MLDFEAADVVESNVFLLSALKFRCFPHHQTWCRKSLVILQSSFEGKCHLAL